MSGTRPSPANTVSLDAYVQPVWQRKWLVVLITIVAAGATYFVASHKTKRFTATTDLYVQVANPTVQNIATIGTTNQGPTADQIGDIVQLITTDAVMSRVAHVIGRPVSKAGKVTATNTSGSDFITITAVASAAPLASRLANLTADQYIQLREGEYKASARLALRAARITLRNLPKSATNVTYIEERQTVVSEIQNYEQAILNPQAGATQPTPATPPTLPSSPKPKRDAIFGGGLGLLLAIALCFMLEALDSQLGTAEDFEAVFRRPVLAMLAQVSNANPTADGGPSLPVEFVEALRLVRYQLHLNPVSGAPRTILVTSCLPSEGKSTVTRDLALTYAKANQRVLLIDGDLRRGALASRLGVSTANGLSEVLIGECSLEEAVVTVALADTDSGSLDLLVGGMFREASNVLSARQMRDVLADAAGQYDVVLMDTSPLLLVADATPLLPAVDAVIVVARLGILTKQDASRLSAVFERVGDVNFAGLVVNGFQARGKGAYGYGYGYGVEDSDKRPSRGRRLRKRTSAGK